MNSKVIAFCKKVVSGLTLILVCYSSPAFSQDKKDTVSFIHLSDVHFVNLSGYDSAIITKRKHMGNVFPGLHKFLTEITAGSGIRFLTITGDMIDFYQGIDEKGDLKATQIQQFSRFVEKQNMDIPIYMALGNHDIHTDFVSEDHLNYIPTQVYSGQARAEWIREVECFKNGTYYNKSIQIGKTKYELVFLDNGYYYPSDWKGEDVSNIDEYQLKWLEYLLKSKKDAKFIIFSHIPIRRSDNDDMAKYKNKYYTDPKDSIPITYSVKSAEYEDNLRRIVSEFPSIKLLLAGHQHASALNKLTFSNGSTTYQVITGAFAYDERNWRLINLTEDQIILNFPGTEKNQYKISVRETTY